MDYLAIDFETANSRLTSACSIGLVGVKNDKIIFEEHHLINPEEYFSLDNIYIHNITEEMVEGEETFPGVWKKISKYFENTVVIAHNAHFDLSVLKAMLEKYGLTLPNIKYACTLKFSRIIWKEELTSFRLSSLALFLDVELDHHNALSDARVCYEIIKRANLVLQSNTIDEINERLRLRYGKLAKDKFYIPLKINKHYPKEKILDNDYLNKKSIYLAGKPKGRSKKKMSEDLLRNGVYLENDVISCLDYFVILDDCPKGKLDKLKYIINAGAKIKLITEEEIYKFVL